MQQRTAKTMFDALTSDRPAPDMIGDTMLFAPLIGAWDLEVFDFEGDGSKRVANGEWLFSWVLEGRAVQDVLIVPKRDERHGNLPLRSNRFGTHLRFYNVPTRSWHTTWVDPAAGLRHHAVTDRIGGEIVEHGTIDDGTKFRRVFSQITDVSFLWRCQRLLDDGVWETEAEFHAHRRAPDQA